MDRIIRFLYTLSSIKWWLVFEVNYLFSREFRSLLKKNEVLKDIHKGKRCFVVGNGPSLRDMNLLKLKGETVFTVNFLMKNSALFSSLAPTYHVIIDPFFSKLSEKDLDVIIQPLKDAGVKLLISQDINHRFIEGKYSIPTFSFYMKDNWYRGGWENIDLTKNTYSAENVVQAAICFAMYMGFKEIVLIGCEFTGIYESFEYNANRRVVNKHAYEIEDKEQYKKGLSLDDNCHMLGEYYRVFSTFKILRGYAERHNVKIINATTDGILDVFPRKKFDDLFQNIEE